MLAVFLIEVIVRVFIEAGVVTAREKKLSQSRRMVATPYIQDSYGGLGGEVLPQDFEAIPRKKAAVACL